MLPSMPIPTTPMGALVELVAEEIADRMIPRLIAALAPPASEEPVYMRVAAYAKRAQISERHVWSLVRKGMPTVGSGRSRRVDVARADEWLRAHGQTDDAIERRARADATRAAQKAAR
jgi:hypothetical protein